MRSKMSDMPVNGLVVELEEIPAPLLRKLMRRMMASRVAEREVDDEEGESQEEERKKLADLHEEKKGAAPKVPVNKDDLPEGLSQAEDEPEEKKKKS